MGESEAPIAEAREAEERILLIRGQWIMLDAHLAELYGVTTGNLNKAVRRNIRRFLPNFMFDLTREEYAAFLRFQFGILERGAQAKYLPCAFTEQGVAMLSSVLRSDRAIQANIEIMRALVRLRKMLLANEELVPQLAALERRHDKQFKLVFDAIWEIMAPPVKPKPPIGFKVKEKRAVYRGDDTPSPHSHRGLDP
jgi:hypothetical protein